MTARARQVRHLMVVLAMLIAASGAAPLPSATGRATAQQETEVERFTVTDVRGNQSAPRVDGRWVIYEDDRRQVEPVTPTATVPVTPTVTPVVVTSTPAPETPRSRRSW